jgi:hypothetical protein
MRRSRATCEIKVNVAVASCLWALVALVALLLGATRPPGLWRGLLSIVGFAPI